ncbi:hypothetical protein C8R45DRAFT_1112167 [Mycena sanguinolenta]|nr:hypothetical protein C8R45DRAFT_1112167 [Mycena sanguinolenta]
MAPKSWATDEQQAFLHPWVSDFVRKQAEKKLPAFFGTLYPLWFPKFPEHVLLGLPLSTDPNARQLTDDEKSTLGAAIRKRKQRLETWFRYQRKKISNGNAVASAREEALVDVMFDMKDKPKKRAPQAVEVFQRRNRETIQKALVAAGYDKISEPGDDKDDWTDESDGSEAAQTKSLKSVRMRTRTRVVAELWKDASEAERAAVLVDLEKEKEQMAANARDEEEAVNKKRTASQLQDGVDGLDTFLSKVLRTVHKGSGWVGVTLVGGPNPRMGGDLSMKIVCHGTTPAGNDFEDSCIDFEKNVIEPFEGFLQQVYTPEQCSAVALDARTPEANDPSRPAIVIAAPAPAPVVAKKSASKRPKKGPVVNAAGATSTQSSTTATASSPVPIMSVQEHRSTVLPVPQSTEDEANTSVDIEDEPFFSGSNDDEASQSQGASANEPPFESFDPPSPSYDNDDSACQTRHGNGSSAEDNTRWPPGMSAPLSPAAAAQIASFESGGTRIVSNGGQVEGPTMVIDPQLIALSDPASSSAQGVGAPPRPRATFRGAPYQPQSAERQPTYRLSGLFDAFRRPPTTPNLPTPRRDVFGLSNHTPQHIGIGSSPKPIAKQTSAARVLSGLITSSSTVSSTPVVVVPSPSSAAPSPSIAAPSTSSITVSSTSSITVSSTSIAVPSPPITVSPMSTAVPSPPIAVPPTPISAPPVLIVDAPPLTPIASSTFVAPGSRPLARPIDEPIAKTAEKAAAKPRKGTSKTGRGKVAQKEAAAKEALGAALATKNVQKKRGRPSKAANTAAEALTDITNDSVPDKPAVPIYTISNNNRAAAQQAAMAAEVAEKKAADDARAAQRAKGWELGPVERTVVLLRKRKPRLNPDGSLPDRVVKNVRPPRQLDACEKALLARTPESGVKRKAVDAPSSTKIPSTKKSKK